MINYLDIVKVFDGETFIGKGGEQGYLSNEFVSIIQKYLLLRDVSYSRVFSELGVSYYTMEKLLDDSYGRRPITVSTLKKVFQLLKKRIKKHRLDIDISPFYLGAEEENPTPNKEEKEEFDSKALLNKEEEINQDSFVRRCPKTIRTLNMRKCNVVEKAPFRKPVMDLMVQIMREFDMDFDDLNGLVCDVPIHIKKDMNKVDDNGNPSLPISYGVAGEYVKVMRALVDMPYKTFYYHIDSMDNMFETEYEKLRFRANLSRVARLVNDIQRVDGVLCGLPTKEFTTAIRLLLESKYAKLDNKEYIYLKSISDVNVVGQPLTRLTVEAALKVYYKYKDKFREKDLEWFEWGKYKPNTNVVNEVVKEVEDLVEGPTLEAASLKELMKAIHKLGYKCSIELGDD